MPRAIRLVLFAIGAYRLASSDLSIDLSKFDFSDLLALILALFAVAMSVAFYFKSTDSSNQFYDNNRYVEGSSTPIFRTDTQGDSFQQRRLSDGSVHEVLKNFPSREELLAAVSDFAADAEVAIMDYFWILSYRLK